MTANRPIRAYTHRESSDGFLPSDVLDALGEPSHIRQGSLIVFATTATEAWRLTENARLGVRSPRGLRIAEGSDAQALTTAGYAVVNAMFAMPMNGNAVVHIQGGQHFENSRHVERIGELTGDYRTRRFVPDVAPQPVVTDAMLDAAYEAFGDAGGCWNDVSSDAMRAAIEAALRVKDDQR